MFVSATQKDARMSPRKIRPYARMIQGMTAEKAVGQLTFAVGKAPEILLHVLKSALANAVNTHDLTTESLKVSSILVNQGLVMKRFMPVAKGMAHPILKRTAHVTVIVEGVEAEKKGKKSKKAGIKTVTAGEFVAAQEKEHVHQEKEVTKKKKADDASLKTDVSTEERTVESTNDKKNYTAFQKTKMNQQGGDAKKTHRRKSIG